MIDLTYRERKKLTHFLGASRVDEATFERLGEISHAYNIPRSELQRLAVEALCQQPWPLVDEVRP